jgi:lipopolysaccharide transport system ATP-binding protein
MSSVITIENLSKKYIIGHQKQERYTALRDVLANGARRLTQKLCHPFAVPENDPTHEEFWALKDVSFDVKQGDRVGIIGRNGAGKSTLLKILSRITEPTSGRVSIKGRVASLLEVGTGFHPELTGRENIFMNGAILGMSKAEIKSKFDEIVAFSEVERFLDTPVKRYSSGMYVRLAFAVAAHLEPEILIVDEVLAVGDAQFQKKCLGKMEDVAHRSGRTILFVSHSMAAIENLCNRCILLSKGQLAAQGETGMVLREYAQTSQSSQTIGDRTDRGGDGKIRLTSFLMRAMDGQVVSSVQTGKTVLFEFEINNAEKNDLTGVLVAFGISNLSGVRLAHFNSDLCGHPISSIPPGVSRIALSLPAIPLVAGRYTITTFVSVKGVIADWVQDAVAIDIDDGDFFGSGRSYSAAEGQIYIPHTIEIVG